MSPPALGSVCSTPEIERNRWLGPAGRSGTRTRSTEISTARWKYAPSISSERAAPRPFPLILLAAAVMILAAVGALPRWPGLVQQVSLPPLDLLADLRVLLVRAPSWPVFVVGLLASLAVRAAVVAAMLGALDRRGYRFALGFYVLALPLALVSAVLSFAGSALLFGALFWFGFGIAVVLTGIFGAVPWTGGPMQLRRRFVDVARRGFRAGTILAALAAIALLGAAADLLGALVSVLLVPVSAAVTWATIRTLRNPGRFVVPRRVVAAGTAAALLGIAIVALSGPERSSTLFSGPGPRPGSLVLMSGVDSRTGYGAMFRLDPSLLGFGCDQTTYYSYAGTGGGAPQGNAACPIRSGAPFDARDTYRSLDDLVATFVAQIDSLPSPIVVVAQSQGAWVVRDALTEHGALGISDVVLAGGFGQNPVGYPPDGGDQPGRVGIDLVKLGERLPLGFDSAFAPDLPLSRELLSSPRAVEELFAPPLPDGVRMLSVPSSFDLPLLAERKAPHATDACPAPVVHPNLVFSGDFTVAVNRFLDDLAPRSCSAWRTASGPLLHAFAAPPD